MYKNHRCRQSVSKRAAVPVVSWVLVANLVGLLGLGIHLELVRHCKQASAKRTHSMKKQLTLLGPGRLLLGA